MSKRKLLTREEYVQENELSDSGKSSTAISEQADVRKTQVRKRKRAKTSTSDGIRNRKHIQYSCMKQPALIKQLKGILSEYPDGGQILKELIQNAEDAGAREVKILFDKRRINDCSKEDASDTTTYFTKFFKGPALCVYNDAVFTDKDWEGIQMIYNSVKEKDPLKVGRFGLGFKSVFHISDFPSIVSGDKLLLIDPQQSSGERVYAMLEVTALDEYTEEGMDPDAFWRALNNTFDLAKDTLGADGFRGTLFWFPLREKASQLSETLYTETKVNDLFDSFQSEAENVLLFLKNIERISLHTRDVHASEIRIKELISIEIEDESGKVRKQREDFKKSIENAQNDQEDKDLYASLHMRILNSSPDMKKRQEWLIVNYFVRESASPDFKRLISDKNLGYSPYVGVAAPVNAASENFEGHVFCFLPLPREGERLTGLPVHINGYFALSQNRHHMKWETDEQEGKKIDDKSILWNKALIEEALPKAYKQLVLEAIQDAERNLNNEKTVSSVYNLLPLCESSSRKTHKRWTLLADRLYEQLKMSNLVFVPHLSEWIPLHEACFATLEDLSGNKSEMRDSVIRCLQKIGLKYANVPNLLFQTLQIYFPNIEDLTPLKLAAYLRERDMYMAMSHSEKLHVLEYLLSNGDSFMHIQELQLLPLSSDKFAVFQRSSPAVFISSEEVIKMFPGLEDKFVTEKKELGDSLAEHMENICKSEMYQIQEFTDDCAKRMLKQMISSHFGSDSHIKLTRETSLKIDWLQNVWQVLVDKQMTKHYKDIPLVPLLISGHWPIPLVVELVKLTDFLVLKKQKDTTLPEGLCFCLRAMSVKVLDDLPEWFPLATIERDIHHPTKEGIVSLLGGIFKKLGETAVVDFNTACQSNSEMVESFVQYLTTLACIENDAKELLTRLKLFKAVRSVDDTGVYVSVFEIRQFISGDIDIPSGVQFPVKCIRVEKSRNAFMKQLGAENISVASLIQKIVKHLLHYKHHDQTILLMDYLIQKPDMIERNEKICEYASQLPFLKAGDNWYKPSDLFDPTSSCLQNLLLGEKLFPEQLDSYQPEEIRVLRKLGLKGEDKVDASVLLHVAKRLDSMAMDSKNSEDLSKKASAFMDTLVRDPHLLNETCGSSSTLGGAILNLSCIQVADAPSDYPVGLPWFSNSMKLCKPSQAKISEFCLLSGAIVPMVDCTSGTLIKHFKWDLVPDVEMVLNQMSFIRRYYNVKYKPDYTRAVQKIYKYMNQHRHKVLDCKNTLKNEELIWVGSDFQIPAKVIMSKGTNDIDLEPYFFYLPEEFKEMEDLFLQLGCYRKQNSHTLLSVLQTIQRKHLEPTDTSILSVKRDTEIVLQILNLLASERKSGTLDIDDSEILMLTEPDSAESLCLQHVSDCIFDNDEDELDPEEEGNSYFVVNSQVPVYVAEELGVKSLKRKTILGATEELSFENWGQSEPLTTRICTLLRDGYKDGLSVPKELVQNADDAGASIVKFLYDERENNDARRKEKMLSSGLIECQGPALWVYNDSLFTEEDLVNITKLNGATKAEYKDKIGKFGLGFCSVYNLTDVPSFISGKDMVIFDPHETYLEDAREKRGKGLRIRLSKRHLIRRSVDQFKPYNSVFGCNLLETNFSTYNGTLFRLPLRTELQAKKSEICKQAYSKADVSALVSKLIENAGNILLFSQCVTTVEVYHLQYGETDPARAKLIFSVKKNTENMNNKTENLLYDCVPRNVQGVLKRVPTFLKKGKGLSEIHRVDIIQKLYDSNFTGTEIQNDLPQELKSSWIVSWALGENESLRLSKVIADKGAVPLSSVAIPVMEEKGLIVPVQDFQHGFYREGHLFCFLPLPIKTDLRFHINGCFNLTSDRRGLVNFNEDDKRKDEKFRWNWVLMEDSVVKGYVELLIFLSKMCSDGYTYSSLWPLKGTSDLNVLKESFCRTLFIDKPKLFKGVKDWLSIDEIEFLDPSVRCNKEIGDIAFELLSAVPARLQKSIIEMPGNVMKVLKGCQVGSRPVFSQAMITEEELILHFLSTIGGEFWDTRIEKRNKFVLYALKSENVKVFKKLQETKCIPSDPENILCCPNELVNPLAEIAAMFKVSDGKFPQRQDGFTDKHVIEQLVKLGMNDKFLSKELLIDRCRSVEETMKTCGCCARERCLEILKYCGRWNVFHQLNQDKDTVIEMRRNMNLPVLPCPSDWKFSWKADELQDAKSIITCSIHQDNAREKIQFAKPTDVFRKLLYIYSGSICCFVDETYLQKKYQLHEDVFKIFGVKSELTVDILSQQLTILPDQYENPDQQFSSLEKISRSVYDYLAGVTSDKLDEELAGLPCFIEMREIKVILVGRELIKPCIAAFNVREECPPELYRLSEPDNKRKRVVRALGVRDHFPVSFLASVLQKMYSVWFQQQCTPEVIDTVACILKNLYDSMKEENTSLENLLQIEKNIVAPDEDGFLRPTKELVIEDPAYKSSATLHILHGKISPDTGRALGVMSKQRKIVENFSTSIFMPFGQNESLVTRLTGILEDYPFDSSIMKEFIQNADDAGATEIHIIKNYSTFPSGKLFGKTEMHGPSLCIFNDSYFTENDFKGIKKLGIGSKRDDPLKTGQYGIGFNAAYHITDVPSFLSKGPGLGEAGQLCIFDPLMTYLEGHVTKKNPGIRCDAALVEESFPDMLLGYPVTSTMKSTGQGTVFRLPLRLNRSALSSNVLTVDGMNDLIEKFKLDMFECLLFLKSVKCIKVFENTAKGLIEEFSVETKLSAEDTVSRNRFFSEVREVERGNIEARQNNLCMQPLESIYTAYIEDSKGRSERWLIVNRFGNKDNEDLSDDLLCAVKEKVIGLTPVASVALLWPVNNWKTTLQGKECGQKIPINTDDKKAFCFLPLPIQTGLPMHVNGHFALDKSRTKLLDEGIRKCWNHFVIEKLLSRAMVSAIQYLKYYFVEKSETEYPGESINSVLRIYHKQFPLLENASDLYWKSLVRSFYCLLVRENVEIFPSVQMTNDAARDCSRQQHEHAQNECAKLHLEWVALSKSENDFRGMFNDIPHRFSFSSTKVACCVEKTLKKLGLKIIDTPLLIRDSLKMCKVEYVPLCSPAIVIDFLKTYSDSAKGSCQLGGINVLLTDTTFVELTPLKYVLEYVIFDEMFKDKVDGLPLCLTNDGILHAFARNTPVFCSSVCDTLTGSSNQFIHSDLVNLTNTENFYEAGVIKHFGIKELLCIMAETFDPSVLATGHHVTWNKDRGEPLHASSLCGVLNFINNKSNQMASSYSEKQNHFQENVHKLDDWALMPSCQMCESQTTFELVPIFQTSHLFYSSHGNENVCDILLKFNIPTLDSSVFVKNKSQHLIYPLQKMLPSTDLPLKLLECLTFYKRRIQSCKLTCEESLILLSYFENRLDQMRKEMNDRDLKQKLESLPLYISYQGTVTSIEQYRDVIVLPSGIPLAGIDFWAQQTGILLLQDTDKLTKLYQLLNLAKMKKLDIYLNKLLPNINHFPRDTWEIHIAYIKDNLLVTSYHQKLNNKQLSLVEQIKHLAFVKVRGKDRRANELYYHGNPVFACMLTEDMFLPEKYRNDSWLPFMESLELNTDPTGEMLIAFACELEAKIRSPVTELTRRQSCAMLECLYNGSWSEDILQRIRNLKFVVPYKVDSSRQQIVAQPGDGKILICLAGAASWKDADYCWSTLNLLPCVPKCNKMLMSLGIFRDLPVDKIVQHCQNIADKLEHQLQRGIVSLAFVKDLMEKLYEKLLDNFNPSMINNFQVTPIVFQPEDKKMLQVRQIVINLDEDKEVRPYLYKLHNCYGPYAELFSKLGADMNARCCHYSMVLEAIKQLFQDKPVSYNQLLYVRKAIENIVQLLPKESNPFQNVNMLYIPDKKQILKCSNTLTVSNNIDIEERIDGRIELDLFLGFNQLDIKGVSDPALPFQMFPEHLRPDILSEVVLEQISSDQIEIENSIKAQQIERLLRSRPVVEGILRLVKQQMKYNRGKFDESIEQKYILCLTNVCVTKVSGLRTFLTYRGRRIEGTDRDASCFVKSLVCNQSDVENIVKNTLYYQSCSDEDILNNLIDDPCGLGRLVDICTDGVLEKELSGLLPTILRILFKPNEIRQKLDRFKIDAYNLQAAFDVSVFPEAGTYVEERFHAFLQQDIYPFKEHEYEYIALEIDDTEDDIVYIYAHIVRENKRRHGERLLDITYKVNVGDRSDGFIDVPISSLYKFVPVQEEESSAIEVYDIEPIGSLPIDENFRRVREMLIDAWNKPDRKRIIRRLLTRWHPDRNRENQEYAQRVFNYINEVVIKLENEKLVDSNVTNETGRMPPDMSRSSFGSASEVIYNRGCRYARAFHDNMRDYNRSTRTGNFSQYRAQEAAVPHIGKAKRWHRQAQLDFRAAQTNLSTGEEDCSYNWVCYKCHQAAEKALKAAWFSKNANRAMNKDHGLTNIASGLDDGQSFFTEATELESITGNYFSMRYPDAVVGHHQIPSEMYDSTKAGKALQVTRRILDMASEFIG